MERTTINTNFNKSLTKAVAVLKCFTPQEIELSATEVAYKVRIPKTTAHRILRTFAEAGLLEQNLNTRKYTIGPLLHRLGSLYLSTADVLKAAEPVLKKLNELSSLDVNLGMFDHGYVTVVMRVLAKSLLRYDVRVGAIVPAHTSSMGKAFLSELTVAELDNLYPRKRLQQRTERTIATKKELKLQLEKIRKSRIAFTTGEGEEGMEGIASLIRDASGKAVAAMSIHLPSFKANDSIREQLAMLVKKGSNLVSYRLGYHDSDDPVHDIREIDAWWAQNQPGSTE